ncbi:hexose carrier protein HEX6-like [Phoenix dactylifera]|uniref:Hexose carrier protein HEX6-like n=1 Tax=Phoenix dactylifera TaxID=42345 RepID=A0A8B8ZFW4_PHODC|nr:hexose carrier protein HEX6-like [Phoenix dactylifera]
MALRLSSKSKTCHYSGRVTPLVILSCMVAATGGILFGYDLGISGGVTSMEPFLEKFFPKVHAKMRGDSRNSNYCMFDSQLLTAFTSSLYIAGLFASLCASWVTHGFGRRRSMLLGGASFLAGAAVGGLALNIYMLIIGRILLGIGIGFTNQSVPLYLSELAPPRYRGLLNNAFEVFVGLGVLFANLINYGTQKIHSDWSWRTSLLLALVPAASLTLGTLFLPETPNSLLQRNENLQEAAEILKKMRGTADVQDELNDMIAAANISKTVRHPFHTIMQRKYRPQLVMAIAIPFFQQATGINVITFYAPVIFRIIGLGESSSLMSTAITGVAGTGTVIVAMMMVDKFGRRALFLIGGVQMIVAHVMVGAIMLTQLGDSGGMSRAYAYMVLALSCAFVAGFGLSWGPLGWLVPSEIFPLEIRSVGQSIVVAVGLLFAFILAQALLTMLCHLKSGVFFFFGGWVLVMTIFVYLLLPETKNQPIEQMDRVWREHWFWKKVITDAEERRNMDATDIVTNSHL